jgi:ribosome maturation factor RimP
MGGFIQPIFFAVGESDDGIGSQLGARQRRRPRGKGGVKQVERNISAVQTSAVRSAMTWQQAIERTVGALGYELVDVERAPGGLLRVFIDRVAGRAYETGPGEAVTVADCELATRQLQYALDVDAVDYARLEVSSPGLDRPLRKPADWQRFAGNEVDLTLRSPFQGRKRWRGRLQPRDAGWRLVLPPQADGTDRTNQAPDMVLDFELNEVREARLVPQLDFKGRRARPAA